jgi:hypothetical protein
VERYGSLERYTEQQGTRLACKRRLPACCLCCQTHWTTGILPASAGPDAFWYALQRTPGTLRFESAPRPGRSLQYQRLPGMLRLASSPAHSLAGSHPAPFLQARASLLLLLGVQAVAAAMQPLRCFESKRLHPLSTVLPPAPPPSPFSPPPPPHPPTHTHAPPPPPFFPSRQPPACPWWTSSAAWAACQRASPWPASRWAAGGGGCALQRWRAAAAALP